MLSLVAGKVVQSEVGAGLVVFVGAEGVGGFGFGGHGG